MQAAPEPLVGQMVLAQLVALVAAPLVSLQAAAVAAQVEAALAVQELLLAEMEEMAEALAGVLAGKAVKLPLHQEPMEATALQV